MQHQVDPGASPEAPLQSRGTTIIGTDQRDSVGQQERLIARSYFDEITGLFTRRLFISMLNMAARQSRLPDGHFGIVSLDIDGFSGINEALGRQNGDVILMEVGKRLREAVRQSDAVSRFADDQFAVLLTGLRRPDDIEVPVRNIMEALEPAIVLGEGRVRISVSAGSAVFPDDGGDADTLISRADAAMREARYRGGRQHLRYRADIGERLRRRLDLEVELDRAIDTGEIALWYQPKIDLRTGKLCGCEALARWLHPVSGMISPAEFIPVAEETGLIVRLGLASFRRAADQIAHWRQAGLNPPPGAINLSPRQITDPVLEVAITDAITDAGITAADLEIELTESSLIQDETRANAVLRYLSDAGITIALDDFGTGYSSLRLLQHFPINVIKIDRSFVQGIPEVRRKTQLVRGVIGLAHELELRVVAEGVETQEQLMQLKAYDCDMAQGFYFDRALPASQFAEAWLDR